jgi:NAD+ synthase
MQHLSLDMSRVHQDLVNFLKSKVHAAGFDGLVLGLSGGIDSALAAALAKDALGADRVLGILMPWRTSSEASVIDAREVAEHLGIQTIDHPISSMVDAFTNELTHPSPLRLGNIMARVRMICIFDEGARLNYLPLGTSNRSELLLGYGTLHGDLASVLNPLGRLYKQQVFALSRHLGLPKAVLEKAPSADLEAGQTDEADIGWDYATIDRVLHRAFDLQMTPEQIIADGLPERAVKELLARAKRFQFKAELPYIAQISSEDGTHTLTSIEGKA